MPTHTWCLGLLVAAYSVTLLPASPAPLCIVYAEEDAGGIGVMAAVANGPPQTITHLPNYSLPVVGCEPNFEQCKLSCFPCEHGGEEGTLCCTLPVVSSSGKNGLAVLQLWQQLNQQSSTSLLTLQNATVVTHIWDCVMGHTFDREQGDRIVTCFNTTTSDSLAYMLFVYLRYGSSETVGFEQPHFTLFNNFPGALSLSNTLYLSESDGDCLYPENLFFVSSSEAYTTNIRDRDIIYIAPPGTIPDCLYPIDVASIETNRHLLLRVQCSQHITKLITACGSHRTVEVYDSRVNGTVYQCRVPGDVRVNVNVTLGQDSIRFTATDDVELLANVSESHPFEFMANISYGFCNVRNGLHFVFGLSNGSVFSFSFNTGKTSILARNSCNSSTDTYTRGECYKAHLYNPSGVVLVYDYEEYSFVVANLSCPEDPVVARIAIGLRPPLTELVSLEGLGGSCPSSSTHSFTSSPLSPSVSSVSPTTRSIAETSFFRNESVVASSALTSSTLPMMSTTHKQTGKPRLEFLALLALTVPLCVLIILIILAVRCCIRKMKKGDFYRIHDPSIHSSENGGTEMSSLNVQPETASGTQNPDSNLPTTSGGTALSDVQQSITDPPSVPVVSTPDSPPNGGTHQRRDSATDLSSQYQDTAGSAEEDIPTPCEQTTVPSPLQQPGNDDELQPKERPKAAMNKDSQGKPLKSKNRDDSRSRTPVETLNPSHDDSPLPEGKEKTAQPTFNSSLPSNFLSDNPGELANVGELERPSQATISPKHTHSAAVPTSTERERDESTTTPHNANSSRPQSIPLDASPGGASVVPNINSGAHNTSPSHHPDPYFGLNTTTNAIESSPPSSQVVVPGQFPLLPSPAQAQPPPPQQQQQLPRRGQRQGGSTPIDPTTGEQQSRHSPGP